MIGRHRGLRKVVVRKVDNLNCIWTSINRRRRDQIAHVDRLCICWQIFMKNLLYSCYLNLLMIGVHLQRTITAQGTTP